jgi:hypothetical protein
MTSGPGGAARRGYPDRMQFHPRPQHRSRHEDEIAGTRPALLFALALGAITGGTAVALFAGGSALIAHFGGVGGGAEGLLVGAATWLLFSIGLGAGLAAGLALGYRVWATVGDPFAPRRDLPLFEHEETAAVEAAEALLHEAAHHRHDV